MQKEIHICYLNWIFEQLSGSAKGRVQISYLHKHLAKNSKLHIAVVFSAKLALVAAKNAFI